MLGRVRLCHRITNAAVVDDGVVVVADAQRDAGEALQCKLLLRMVGVVLLEQRERASNRSRAPLTSPADAYTEPRFVPATIRASAASAARAFAIARSNR